MDQNPQNGGTGGKWEKRYQEVSDFSTVQEFWKLFSHLLAPSKLRSGSDYHLFKKGIEPEWEHPKHVGGGAWTLRSQSKDSGQQADYIWFQTLLALVGNSYDKGEFVTGVVVSVHD
eukprot:UN00235